MIGSRLQALWRALVRPIDAARRLGPEHRCGKITAAGEASAAAYDDERLPGRAAGDAPSVATGRRG